MTVARKRAILTADSVPILPAHVRLVFNEKRESWVVLAPEKILWPDDISVLILQNCDGARSIGEIARALSKEFSAPSSEILGDILEFLQDWSDRLLIRLAEQSGGKP
ncbi:pyrroloquinoline quinone biosynthesis peptide chaperone PqqD [Roseibium sp. MMSF_3412]|uniref:pyrroloquinoline quinone biosynthesis peptide chaperone PqqD n=1 Tax=Roseibium sp. MMSF_3412 TaxID=3046712 RepID=UPI00273E931A|nr:pyrroloquinoline quinone biosynthesis peptide chaperone PqqD [Roseibium sp. MMSF_3412]